MTEEQRNRATEMRHFLKRRLLFDSCRHLRHFPEFGVDTGSDHDHASFTCHHRFAGEEHILCHSAPLPQTLPQNDALPETDSPEKMKLFALRL